MDKLYSNEIVFYGHPDKICDQLSELLLKEYVVRDENSRCGIEFMGGKNKIFVTGEVTSNATIDTIGLIRNYIKNIDESYADYEIIDNIGKQSLDIAMGVDTGGAGDNGMMFGYACDDTDFMLPKAMMILQELAVEYKKLVKNNNNFKADGKAQITGIYDEEFRLKKIKSFTICYQNKEINRKETDDIIKGIAINICKEFNTTVDEFYINPTGRFEVGGFIGDAGLTGRKIVVDSYQSFANVGGGNYNGKDMTKVDRSGAYKARSLAKRFLKEKNLKWCEVQLSYSIGMDRPMAIYIDSSIGNIHVDDSIYEECKPKNIIKDLKLIELIKSDKFLEKATYGHFGVSEY